MNFQGLLKLEELLLDQNRIEMIRRATFDDLTSLKRLDLSKLSRKLIVGFNYSFFWYSGYNEIRKINGNVFGKLTRLQHVKLSGNDCIQEEFDSKIRIEALTHSVSEKCGHCEVETVCGVSDEVRDMHSYFRAMNMKFDELQGQIKDLKSQIVNLKNSQW